MFVDFSPEKSLTLKQKLWKALKPGTNHLYTTNIHGRGAQTRATLLLKGSVAGSWAVPAQHLLSSVATMGHTTPSLRPQAHSTSTEGHQHTLPAGQWPTGVCQAENMSRIWQMNLCKQIPECTGCLDGTCVPGLVCKTKWRGNQQLLLGFLFLFFLMQLFNLSSWYGRTNATFNFCLVWLQWHP